MNAKVQEFINKMIEAQNAKELIKKREHLISLGLIDEEKTERKTVYLDSWDGSDCKFDKEKNKYYKEVYAPVAIEITDEEYQEILKYAPLNKKIEDKKESQTTWANAIKVIANIRLVLNIIGGMIFCMILSNSYKTNDIAWIPIVFALTYCILWYPLIIGFSKIVKVAEKTLQE